LKSREEVLLTLVERAIVFMLEGLSPRLIRDSLIESLTKGKVDFSVKNSEEKEKE
jgi:hypothetical protein